MMYIYPSNDLHDPSLILSLMGCFWAYVYDDRELLEDRVKGVAELAEQTHIDFTEMVATNSRRSVPIFHRENWSAVTLRQSAMNTTDAALWHFDDEDLDTFDGDNQFSFDVPFTSNEFTFTLPSLLADATIIQNRVTEPSLVLHKGIDFRLDRDNNGLIFREDLFQNELVPSAKIFENGQVTDYEITLWLFRAEFDWNYVYDHIGYVLDIRRDSSEGYRDLLNAAMNAIVGGTSLSHIETMISAMSGIPLVREPTETVKDIYADSEHLLVITDQHVYRCSERATAAVVVDQTVQAGDPLINEYEKIQPNRGQLGGLTGLVLPRELLAAGFSGPLLFRNEDVPLVVTGAFGQERVEFDIGGHPLDVDLFWDTVHDRRLLYNQSLHELLAEQGLPLESTINPLEFLATNVLRNNVLLFRLQAAGFGSDAVGFSVAGLLRKITPPHVLVLIVIELPVIDDSANMKGADTPGVPLDLQPPLSQNVSVIHDTFTNRPYSFTLQ